MAFSYCKELSTTVIYILLIYSFGPITFQDGGSGYQTALTMCDDNGVILYGLHPHASHIIQPLDLCVFGSMKATWPSIVKTHLDKTGEMASAANFAQLLKELCGEVCHC